MRAVETRTRRLIASCRIVTMACGRAGVRALLQQLTRVKSALYMRHCLLDADFSDCSYT
jgi:hypothetical protein